MQFRYLNRLTFAVSFTLLPLSAMAGPFGLDFDNFDPVKSNCTETNSSFYTCTNIPKPHPDIETYIVQYVESVGLCMIKGVSNDVSDSIYGDNTRRKSDEIYQQLEKKYGKGDRMDFLRSGSIWDRPEDWMMGIVKDERTYATLWKLGSPIDGVSQMLLLTKASNQDTGYVVVEFHNANTEECDKAQSESAADSF